MFYENFIKLCAQKGESPNAVAAKLGLSTGTVTWWKKGRQPREPLLYKIAEYFDVPVDYLLGKPNEKEPEPRERIFFSYAKESEEFHRLLEPIIKDPTPIQTAYDKASPEIQAAVRKLLDL